MLCSGSVADCFLTVNLQTSVCLFIQTVSSMRSAPKQTVRSHTSAEESTATLQEQVCKTNTWDSV